jgi:haloalkane dehalogenase
MSQRTRFTDLVGCRHPIQQAGMGWVAGVELAAAVTAVGGLGMLAFPTAPPPVLAALVDDLRHRTARPVGINFLVPFLGDEAAVTIAAERLDLVEFFWGEPDPRLVTRVHAGGARAAWQVGSVREARAAADAGCDVVVAQGVEAGGHVRGTRALLPLLADVLDAIDVPVLAAGGIATPGRGIDPSTGPGYGIGMRVLRTPDERFAGLPGFDHPPRYAEVPGGTGDGTLRMAYIEAGPPDGPVVLLLHGEPTWSFLYRRMLPVLADAGLRAIAPDLVGFGRSDKPAEVADHSYACHVEWMRALAFDVLDLREVTLVGQDWGGLIGLRLVAEHPGRFAAVVAANTGLPTGDQEMPEIWWAFRRAVETAPRLDIARFVASGCRHTPAPAVLAAYDAPFPDETYKAGPRVMPTLVPTRPDDLATEANRAAWAALARWDKPFLCAFSDGDPITAAMAPILRRTVPGAAGLDHPTITGAGHFLQEDAGERLAAEIIRFRRR